MKRQVNKQYSLYSYLQFLDNIFLYPSCLLSLILAQSLPVLSFDRIQSAISNLHQ